MARNYRKAREEAGIKAERAAAELGVSISTLFSWERGDTSPNAEKVLEMCQLYKTSADLILGIA